MELLDAGGSSWLNFLCLSREQVKESRLLIELLIDHKTDIFP